MLWNEKKNRKKVSLQYIYYILYLILDWGLDPPGLPSFYKKNTLITLNSMV